MHKNARLAYTHAVYGRNTGFYTTAPHMREKASLRTTPLKSCLRLVFSAAF